MQVNPMCWKSQFSSMVCDNKYIIVLALFLYITIVETALFANTTQSIVTSDIGQSVSLYCTVDGYPAPLINWRIGDRGTARNSDKYTIRKSTSQSSFRSINGLYQVTSVLTVNNINSNDAAISYTCRADNEAELPVFSPPIEIALNGTTKGFII